MYALQFNEERSTILSGSYLLPGRSICYLSLWPRVRFSCTAENKSHGRSGAPGSGRPRSLMIYLESLRETQAMPIETVLPGHGDEFGDHVAPETVRGALMRL